MRTFPFTKEDRILKRQNFLKLSASGKKVFNRHYIALFYPSGKENTRIGITVTKRVGNAVTRNRLKRLIREYFRLNKQKISEKLNNNIDINIIVKKNAANLKSKDIFTSLENIFQKVFIYFD